MNHKFPKRWLLNSMLFAALALSACGGAATTPTTPATAPTAGVADSTPAAANPLPTSASEATAAATTVSEATAAATTVSEATTAATSASEATTAPTAVSEATTAATSATVATTKLNLNTATQGELLSTIPNFGNRMVREFFEYRPYVSIQQFRREIGKYVDDQQVAAYEQYVYVPVDVDNADAATLQQLSGVDATIAENLIAARPYNSNAAFLDKLGEYVSDADRSTAAPYLASE